MTEEQAILLLEQNQVLIERIEELLVVGGALQGYAIFGIVVVLMIFSYKFLRMFF